MEIHLGLSRDQPTFSSGKVQAGPPPADLPSPSKRTLGCKDRPERCLLSSSSEPGPKALPLSQSGKPSLGVPSRPFWPKCDAPTLPKSDGGVREEVEKKGGPSIHILGRHPNLGSHPKSPKSTSKDCGGGLNKLRFQNQPEKVPIGAKPNRLPLGIRLKFSRRKTPNLPTQVKGNKEGVRKVCDQNKHVKKTSGGHFGPSKGQSFGSPLSKGFYHPLGELSSRKRWSQLGLKTSFVPRNKRGAKSGETSDGKVGRETICLKTHKNFALGFERQRLGGINPHTGQFVQEYWREESYLHINVKEMKAAINTVQSLAKPNDKVLLCVDNQVIFYYLQKGGEEKPLQSTPTTILALVDGQKRGTPSQVGSFRKVSCRPPKSVVSRQGRLLLGCKSIQLHSKNFPTVYKFRNGSLCKPGQQKIASICGPVATLASKGLRCPQLQPRRDGGTLCKSPLVNHPKVFGKVETFPSSQSFDGRPLLGFHTFVAPINKNEGPPLPLPKSHSLPRDVQKLLGGANATPKVAPFLPDLFRKILEGKQISSEIIDDFISRNKSLKRYSSAFALLWNLLEGRGIPPLMLPRTKLCPL